MHTSDMIQLVWIIEQMNHDMQETVHRMFRQLTRSDTREKHQVQEQIPGSWNAGNAEQRGLHKEHCLNHPLQTYTNAYAHPDTCQPEILQLH